MKFERKVWNRLRKKNLDLITIEIESSEKKKKERRERWRRDKRRKGNGRIREILEREKRELYRET